MVFHGSRVLVVEDDPAAQELMASLLDDMGFDVDVAASGRAATELVRTGCYDLVCLDLRLPDASGFELCDRIRATRHLRDVPILIVSARSLPLDRAEAEERGASAYLLKPFHSEELARHVRALLSARYAAREAAQPA